MPRLPGPEALGNLPSLRSGARPAQVSGENPIAAAANRLGQGVVALSGEMQQREDTLQAAEADAELTTRLTEARRRFDTDPDWQTFEPRFAEEAARIQTEAANRITNPRLRERWMPRAAVAVSSAFDHVRGRQDRMRGDHEFERYEGILGQRTNAYHAAPDDATRQTELRNILDNIELARRTGVVSNERVRDLRNRYYYGTIEADALSRHAAGDGYAALLELREGDARARQPSTGQVSELGLSYMQRLQERPPNQTPAEARAANRRLRTDTARISTWITENVTAPLTQLQHDALVGIGVQRGQDALTEMLPSINEGNWEATAGIARTPGGITALEQPAGAAPATAIAPSGPPVSVVPVPGGRTPVGAAPRQAPIAGIVLHHTAGTTLESALNENQNPLRRGTGYNYYIDRDGTAYVFAPDDQTIGHIMPPGHQSRIPGAWSNLSSGNTIGIAVVAPNDAAMTDAQRETLRRLTSQISAQHNIDPQNIIGHGDIQHTRERTEGILAREFREGRAAPRAPADPRSDEMADMLVGQAPSSRYAQLPPQRRRVLANQLSESLRNETRAEVESDLESIRRTGEPRRLPDGTTWIERANRILVPNQAALVSRRVQEAYAQHRALQGLTDMTPEQIEQRIDDLSTTNVPEGGDYALAARTRQLAANTGQRILRERSRDPVPFVSGMQIVGERGRVRTGPDGQLINTPDEDDIRVRPAQEITTAFEMLSRRRPDLQIEVRQGPDGEVEITAAPTPGQTVDPTQMRPQRLRITDPRLTPEDRSLIIEARLRAQVRLQFQEGDRRTISRAEAAELLRLPTELGDMDERELRNRTRAAADRAFELFGPRYARAVYDDAIDFRRLNERRGEIAREAANRLPGRGPYTEAELNRLRTLNQLDREEAIWRYGAPVTAIPTTPGMQDLTGFGPGVSMPPAPAAPPRRWYQSAPPPESMVPPVPNVPRAPFADAYGRAAERSARQTATRARPSPQDITDLQRFPQLWQDFDARFGVGAAAAYLQGQQPRPEQRR